MKEQTSTTVPERPMLNLIERENAARLADKKAETLLAAADELLRKPARDNQDLYDLQRMEGSLRQQAKVAAEIAAAIRALSPPREDAPTAAMRTEK